MIVSLTIFGLTTAFLLCQLYDAWSPDLPSALWGSKSVVLPIYNALAQQVRAASWKSGHRLTIFSATLLDQSHSGDSASVPGPAA